jgi:hypothetical protein
MRVVRPRGAVRVRSVLGLAALACAAGLAVTPSLAEAATADAGGTAVSNAGPPLSPAPPSSPGGPVSPPPSAGAPQDDMVDFSATRQRATVRPDGRVRLRFRVENRTTEPIVTKTLARAPKELDASTGQPIVAWVGTEASRTVAVVLAVGGDAEQGRHRVRVIFEVGGMRVCRTVMVRVRG